MSEYDFMMKYHPQKDKCWANALSRKPRANLAHVEVHERQVKDDTPKCLDRLEAPEKKAELYSIIMEPALLEKVRKDLLSIILV